MNISLKRQRRNKQKKVRVNCNIYAFALLENVMSLCRFRTKRSTINRCIYTAVQAKIHNPTNYKEGDTWTCPYCGKVLQKVKNVDAIYRRQYLLREPGHEKFTLPRFTWATVDQQKDGTDVIAEILGELLRLQQQRKEDIQGVQA